MSGRKNWNRAGLKPCPFCGGDAAYAGTIHYEGDSPDWTRGAIGCLTCGVRTRIGFRQQVVKLWNKRAAAPGTDEVTP